MERNTLEIYLDAKDHVNDIIRFKEIVARFVYNIGHLYIIKGCDFVDGKFVMHTVSCFDAPALGTVSISDMTIRNISLLSHTDREFYETVVEFSNEIFEALLLPEFTHGRLAVDYMMKHHIRHTEAPTISKVIRALAMKPEVNEHVRRMVHLYDSKGNKTSRELLHDVARHRVTSLTTFREGK